MGRKKIRVNDENKKKGEPPVNLIAKPFVNGSVQLFAGALVNAFDMGGEEARETTEVVATAFGGNLEVDDGLLDHPVRSLFYLLETKGFLTFRKVEENTADRGLWRTFFWRVNWKKIRNGQATVIPVKPEEDVYSALPKSVWRRGL